MIAKMDVFELLNILRDMKGHVPIIYINRILKVIERDSGKIWSEQLFNHCVDKNISLEDIWEEILNSDDNPVSEYV